jgi:hypothetical protein
MARSRIRRDRRLVSPSDPRVEALVASLQSRVQELEARLADALDMRAAFQEVVRREVAALQPAPLDLGPPGPRQEGEGFVLAVLDIGDMHVGELVTPEDTGGLNAYDVAECRRRAGVLLDRALEVLELHRPSRLHVHLLGDIVAGERIYAGQAWRVDVPLIRQVVIAEEVLASLIARLAEAVPEVRVFCVAGNHGRAGRPGEYHPATNFDVMVYDLLERRMASCPRVRVHSPGGPWCVYEVPELGGQTHLLLHGDGIRISLSIPYYGVDRASREWGRTLGRAPSYIHLGHFHRAAGIQLPRGEQLVNGSWVGATSHALRQFREAVTPEQRMHLFDSRGLVCTHRIRLADVPDLRPAAMDVLEAVR